MDEGHNSPSERHAPLTVHLAGIIRIFGQSLYNEFGAIIRELVQNGHDAVIEAYATQPMSNHTLSDRWVNVQYHSFESVLVVADNGTGMDESDVSKDFTDFGRPKKDDIRIQVAAVTPDQPLYIIGLYGVGFLSALAVSTKVEVWTRKAGGRPLLWEYETGQDFAVVSDPTFDEYMKVRRDYGCGVPGADPHGSIVICRLSEQVTDQYQVSEDAARESLLRYARILRVPVYFNNQRITDESIAWSNPARASRDDWRQMIKEATGSAPLVIIPVYSPPDKLDLEGVLWIPERRKILGDNGYIDIYIRRMFVCSDDKTIRPQWARFIMGMVNSNKMGRTVSGSTTIDDTQASFAREFIKERIFQAFQELCELPEEESSRVLGAHDDLIKNSAVDDPEFLAKVWDKLRVRARNRRVTIPEYMAQVKNLTGRENVAYYYDKSVQEFSAGVVSDATRTPVLTLWTFNDGPFVREVCRLQKIEMRPYTELFKDVAKKPESDEPYRSMIAACAAKRIAADVREYDPPHIAAMLIEDEDLHERKNFILSVLQQGPLKDKQLAAEWQSLSFREGAVNREVSFYLNAKNPLINELKTASFETQQAICLALYNISYMSIVPQMELTEVRAIYNSICAVLRELLKQSTSPPLPSPEPPRPTTLFMMTPFADEYRVVEEAVRDVFEGPPYFFQVVLARDFMKESRLIDNLRAHIDAADGFVAEISELNANVMLELGAVMVNNDRKRPVFLLRSGDGNVFKGTLPSDLQGQLYIQYASRADNAEAIACVIRNNIEVAGKPTLSEVVGLMQKRRCLALTKRMLLSSRCTVDEQKRILSNYRTVEEFLSVTPDDVWRVAGVKAVVAKFIQAQLDSFVRVAGAEES